MGGLFLVDSPEQRRTGIRDSFDLALQDWLGGAGFDRGVDDPAGGDFWGRRWATAYVDFATGEKRAWLRGLGVRSFPVVGCDHSWFLLNRRIVDKEIALSGCDRMKTLVVRRERSGDVAAIAAVHRAAFGSGDPVEVGLVAALRADPAWLAHLSLVAVADGRLVGHVVATRATVDGAPALGVGPLGVVPAAQGRGIGTALMYALLGAAQARDETLVGLLGEPGFYARFGFVPAAELGVTSPDPAWGRHFQALRLGDAAPRGTFAYAAPFAELG